MKVANTARISLSSEIVDFIGKGAGTRVDDNFGTKSDVYHVKKKN